MHDHLQFVSIVFDDGSVGIMQFVRAPRGVTGPLVGYNQDTGLRESSDEAIEAEIAKSAYDAKPVSWRRIKFEDLPDVRTYRNAWRDNGRELVHDMPAAREIHRNKLRRLRAPLLETLDVEYQRADEREDKAAKRDVAQRKQRLRDVTADPRIEAAQTIDDLAVIGVEDT